MRDEIFVQCFLNLRFCQSITVLGFTIIRESVHLPNTCFNATQNVRSRSVNLGFTSFSEKVESCLSERQILHLKNTFRLEKRMENEEKDFKKFDQDLIHYWCAPQDIFI